MPTRQSRPRATNAEPAESISAGGLELVSSVTAGTDSEREARSRVSGYVVVVRNGGRWTRAIYLSLHSANQAIDRAKARGASPHLVLVRLVPVGEIIQ